MATKALKMKIHPLSYWKFTFSDKIKIVNMKCVHFSLCILYIYNCICMDVQKCMQ